MKRTTDNYLSFKKLGKRTGLSEGFVRSLLEDGKFNSNLRINYKNGKKVGANVENFLRALKGDYFKEKYGYVRSGDLIIEARKIYSDLTLTEDALQAKVVSVATEIPGTLDVSMNDEGARFYLIETNRALKFLKTYLTERTESFQKAKEAAKTEPLPVVVAAPVRQVNAITVETQVVKLTTLLDLTIRANASLSLKVSQLIKDVNGLIAENGSLQTQIQNIVKTQTTPSANSFPASESSVMDIVRKVAARFLNGEIPESHISDTEFGKFAVQAVREGRVPSRGQLQALMNISDKNYNDPKYGTNN